MLGFSQGATATALLLATLKRSPQLLPADVAPPSFAVMCSGFLPRDPSFAQMVRDAAPDTPSLFLFGAADELVPPQRSKELVAAFAPPADPPHGGATASQPAPSAALASASASAAAVDAAAAAAATAAPMSSDDYAVGSASLSASGHVVFQHPGAHLVPSCSGEFKQTLAKFIVSRRSSGSTTSVAAAAATAAQQ